MSGRIEGKVALITGAARGQGRSHAIRLAQEGADIIAVDVCEEIKTVPYGGSTQADLDETVRTIKALDRRITAYQVDVRNYDALKDAVDRGSAELGRLDIVAANAGIASYGRMTELSSEEWQTMVDINLTAVWYTCKAAVPHLIAGGRGGAIVITSSVAGLRASQNNGHYVATKHAVVGLMRTLALELGSHHIRVNTIHPTTVNTAMVTNDTTYRLFRPDLEDPSIEDIIETSTAMHVLPIPWVEPRDISNALLFLVSDEARYVTGACVPVDAGASIK
jgi:(+)-trans-carveol dehydrogenase